MKRRAAIGRNAAKTLRGKRVKRHRAPKARRSSTPSAAGLQAQVRTLTRQLSEALEQQTATSEVLKVISSSPGELESVFRAVMENAVRICEATLGDLYLRDGNGFRMAVTHNAPPAYAAARKSVPVLRPPPDAPLGRVAITKQVVQIADITTISSYRAGDPFVVAGVELARYRTVLAVPMLKDDELIGAITISRREVNPFGAKQIELVTNFAAQAVIAIENARLLGELRQRTDDLTESLEQQTATAEILRVISRSLSDTQPAFDAIVQAGLALFPGSAISIELPKDGEITAVAIAADDATGVENWRKIFPFPLTREYMAGVAIFDRRIVDVADAREGSSDLSTGRRNFLSSGYRAVTKVPMLRGDSAIGVLSVARPTPGALSDKQLGILTTFAAQAVIAIENTRLLNELRESLQQQTATSDVLKVISRSAFDLQPVLQTLVETAAQLCRADRVAIRLARDGTYHHAASHGFSPEHGAHMRQHPTVADRTSVAGRALLEGRALQVADARADPELTLLQGRGVERMRTVLGVPLMREGKPVGVLVLARNVVEPFADKQVELVTTFADQAVIAIENVRLFDEVQAQKRELTETLEHQTATSEVLNVISRSPTNAKPVFDAIVQSAARLCEAMFSVVWLYDGDLLHYAASHNFTPNVLDRISKTYPKQPDRSLSAGRAILDGQIAHVPDTLADGDYARELALAGNWRASLSVPMLRDGKSVGAISLGKAEAIPFSERQIQLLTTFADQAVIAIENVRLFDEVQARTEDLTESLQQQTATADVLKAISRSTFDLKVVLNTLVESAARLCEADMGAVARPRGDAYNFEATYGTSREFDEYVIAHPAGINRGTAIGRSLFEGKIAHIPDVVADPDYTYREGQRLSGFRTMLAVPLLREGIPIGVLALGRLAVQPFTDKQIELVQTFADQAVIAIENVRLFDEIQDKSRQLAEASQHKSQFLANMSHELRTPLNAIIGYTELIIDGIYGETPDKALAVLKRVESNGRHLLGLINDVLDFSKMEAGQLKLAIADYSMKDVVHNVYSAVEPLAAKKNLNFKVEVPPDMPAGRGDERKLTQVLLNLVGNAIKFTDAGEVTIKVAPGNGSFSVAVHDTGPGIDPANQEKLFEEFQQADNSITKVKGGTGLGLAIARRIIELHGGRLWVDSSPGNGSVFTFEIPSVVEPARPS